MSPRFGKPAHASRTYTDRPGAYALLHRDGLMVITHQSEPITEFQLPGGGIDPGESVLPALHREVLEETGWKAQITRKLGVYRRFTYMPEYQLWARKICHIYLGRPTIRIGPPLEDFHTALWVGPGHAVRMLEDPGQRDFVKRYFEQTQE